MYWNDGTRSTASTTLYFYNWGNTYADETYFERLWKRRAQLALSRAWERAPLIVKASQLFNPIVAFVRRLAAKPYTGRNFRKARY